MQKKIAPFMISFTCLAVSLFAGPIENLNAGEWYEVPNSHMTLVDPCPAGDCSYSGSTSQGSVMGAWGGGAFDTKRNHLIVWGGGHSNYGGNEVYYFDLDSLKWVRANNPSNPPAVDVAYASDGGPCSRHTYNYIQYLPAIDRFCSFGGAGFYVSGQTGTYNVDAFNFDTKAWSRLADEPAVVGAGAIASFSAVDGVTGHVWKHGTGGYVALGEYDPSQDKWIQHGNAWTESVGFFPYYQTAAIDPVFHKFVAVGAGSVYAWNTDTSSRIVAQSVATTGGAAIVGATAPGFEYDPVIGKFVGWNGSADVYILDFGTRAWTRVAPASTNKVTPTAPCPQGTNGRFRYCPDKDVFVLVNDNTQNVFIYKLNNGSGTGNEIHSSDKAPHLRVSPNPARTHSSITFSLLNAGVSGAKASIGFSIHNSRGQCVKKSRALIGNGKAEAQWETAGAAPGIYVGKIIVGNRLFTRTFAVIN